MIMINEQYSIGVAETDGEYVYTVYNLLDEIVAERHAGSAYTGSEESMIELGLDMLSGLKIAKEPNAKITIHIEGLTELQAINFVKTVIEMRRVAKFRTRRRYAFDNGKRKALIFVKTVKEGSTVFTVRDEKHV